MENKKNLREVFIERYIVFKEECRKQNINKPDEIIKLFEVWVRSL